jgi:hypothetical protein
MRVPAAVAAHGPVHRVLRRAGPPLARGLPVPLRDPAAPARRRVASQFLSRVPGRLIGPFLGNSTTSPRAGATYPEPPRLQPRRDDQNHCYDFDHTLSEQPGQRAPCHARPGSSTRRRRVVAGGQGRGERGPAR